MTKYFDSFYMIDDKDAILDKCEEVTDLLRNAYWAKDREYDAMYIAIQNSLNYVVLESGSNRLAGFARVVTDYATIYYLCDVFVAEEFRGKGIGKALVEWIVCHEEKLQGVKGLLKTRDAKALYERFGFEECKAICMVK